MLSISPARNDGSSANFQSASGVVHIQPAQDWTNFEAGMEEEEEDASDHSVQEILGRNTRNGGRRKPSSQSTQDRN